MVPCMVRAGYRREHGGGGLPSGYRPAVVDRPAAIAQPSPGSGDSGWLPAEFLALPPIRPRNASKVQLHPGLLPPRLQIPAARPGGRRWSGSAVRGWRPARLTLKRPSPAPAALRSRCSDEDGPAHLADVVRRWPARFATSWRRTAMSFSTSALGSGASTAKWSEPAVVT